MLRLCSFFFLNEALLLSQDMKCLGRKLKLICSNPIEYKSRHKTMAEQNELRFKILLL